MKRHQIATAAAAALFLCAASGFAADPATTDSSTSLTQKAKNIFKTKFGKADKDSDGTLDKEEAKALPEVAAHFDAIDTDKDGTVSSDEVKTYEKLAKLDKDADGTLDRNEAKGWSMVSKNFEALDTDKDGTVSLAEINTYEAAEKSHSAKAKQQ